MDGLYSLYGWYKQISRYFTAKTQKALMNSNNKKYLEEKNSDELSQRFHEKAGEISKDLNRQLLSLSTGII